MKEFTISLFTENHIGLLNQITIIFTRRQINIESLTGSESAVKGVHMVTIVVNTSPELVEKVAKQLEKLVDVLKVFVHEADEIIYQEIALYKVRTNELMLSNKIEQIVRSNNARFLEITPEYVVIEKTGHKKETSDLLEKLDEFGILQFVRSGRVAITKQIKELISYLREMDAANVSNKE
ncbi:MAG: acetolactate synthase small subunit [Bacteroidetes bacterium]|nr:MAG: acetolactate synthase small subunit [Bacteroidota bacterium]